MRPTNCFASRAVSVAVLIFFTALASGRAGDVLFPDPLHLVRSVGDPFTNSVTRIEEYCSGNRMVSVSGPRTVIVDHGTHQIIEIDRAAGTYSISSFREIATAGKEFPRRSLTQQAAAKREPSTIRPSGMKLSRSGRSADWYEIDAQGGAQRLEIAADREITVSREALDVLTGSAFPDDADLHSEAIAEACRRADGQAGGNRFALPLEQVITIEDDAGKVEFRNSIERVDHELPPADLLAVPAGARLIPSRRTVVPRTLKELDSGNRTPNRP